MTNNQYHAGFVGLIGRPNVGKSTLLNSIVGQKISIVSNKVQTTRHRLIGVSTTDTYQIAFIDTPGIHAPYTQLGKVLNQKAESIISDVDVLLVVIDCSTSPGKDDNAIAHSIQGISPKVPVLLCLNKMDLLKPQHVEENIASYCKLFNTEKYMFTCLTKKQNLDKMTDLIVENLPLSEPMYDPDMLTDQPMRVLAAEILREKTLLNTKKEVPYSIATKIDAWEEIPEKNLVHISASIVVERESQKGIVIGKQGQMLKKIGTDARLDIERLLEQRVFLEVFVKVREDWRQKPQFLQEFGYL